jgi:hypothetical protein
VLRQQGLHNLPVPGHSITTNPHLEGETMDKELDFIAASTPLHPNITNNLHTQIAMAVASESATCSCHFTWFSVL